MTTLQKVAGALSFAHLASLGRSKAAKADDNKDDKDEKDKEAKASDDDSDPDEKDKKDAKADDGDPDASTDDDTDPKDDDKDDKKSKSKKAEDDDDDEKMAAGATKERARCAAIFASPHAAGNVALAAQLAFGTDLSAEQAIKALAVAPAAQRGNPERAARNANIGAGGSSQMSSHQAVSKSMDLAFAKANPANAKRLAG